MKLISGLIAAALVLGPAAARAEPTPPSALLILEKKDERLAVVDPASLRVIARIPAGPDPHEVVASPDGRVAYISNYGGPGSALHTISAVDLVGQRTLAPIDLGPLRSAHGLAFADGKLWFTAETSKAIGRYDPATRTVDWILGTGQDRTHMLWVTPGGGPIYTANVASGTISLIRPSASAHLPDGGWEITNVPTGAGSEGFDVTPGGARLWVASAAEGTIAEIDLAGGQVMRRFTTPGHFANRLKFTLDGRRALVSYVRSREVIILDTASGQVIKRLPLGGPAEGILMEPGGQRAFVAHGPDKVAVIDLTRLAVVGEISVGREPDGMAWAGR